MLRKRQVGFPCLPWGAFNESAGQDRMAVAPGEQAVSQQLAGIRARHRNGERRSP
jgi:hypothetical protein